MANEVKEEIIRIIGRTFDAIDNCYGANDELKGKTHHKIADSRLLFPCYYERGKKKETRISEQELRFLFIEQFNRYCNGVDNLWYYSIETPTKWKYKFSGDNMPPKPHRVKEEDDEKGGQSAMVDVCIHNETGERICLLEFKFGNPEKFCFEKDLVKLEEEGVLCFFVHLLKSQQRDTLPSIWGKIRDITTDKGFQAVDFSKINYICHTLPPDKGFKKTVYIAADDEEFEGMGWGKIQLSDPAIEKQIEQYKKKIENKKKKDQ